MDNLEDLQEYVETYLAEELSKFYDFKFWMQTFKLETLKEQDKLLEKWDKFGKNLKPKLVNVVYGSDEPWTPCINLYLNFHVTKDETMVLAALLQKDKVSYVRIQSPANLPEDFDYVKSFEQRVRLINALSGSEHKD